MTIIKIKTIKNISKVVAEHATQFSFKSWEVFIN